LGSRPGCWPVSPTICSATASAPYLAGNGVDLSFAVRAAEPTSLAIVAVGRDGVVEYDFRVQGTADWQWRDHELAGTLDGNVVALHAGSLALTMPPGADALQQLLAGPGR
jgi:fructokinase